MNAQTLDNSFYQSIRDSVDKAVHNFVREKYEEKKKFLIKDLDATFEREVAGIVLLLSQQIQFDTRNNQIVITIQKPTV